MQGLLKAIAAAGVDQKTFAKDVNINRFDFNKMVNGHINPIPRDFQKICDRAGLPPQAVATADEVDYGIPAPTATPRGKSEANRKKRASLRFRILQKQRKQIDKDLKAMGFATVQSWGDFCIKELHARAQEMRRERKP